jgi:hypothetical protein
MSGERKMLKSDHVHLRQTYFTLRLFQLGK